VYVGNAVADGTGLNVFVAVDVTVSVVVCDGVLVGESDVDPVTVGDEVRVSVTDPLPVAVTV